MIEIPKQVWAHLSELSHAITLAALADDEILELSARQTVLEYIDEMELQYGVSAETMHFRGVFTDPESPEMPRLIHDAFQMAEASGDRRIILEVATTCAEFAIEWLEDAESGAKWLAVMKSHLSAGNADDRVRYEELLDYYETWCQQTDDPADLLGE